MISITNTEEILMEITITTSLSVFLKSKQPIIPLSMNIFLYFSLDKAAAKDISSSDCCSGLG